MSLCLGQTAGAACPDFFRFVDFGQEDVNGLARGGMLLRVESLEGRPLLKRAETVCSPAKFLASDGHGIPIPVATSVTFDAAKLPFGIATLRVRRVSDAFEAASEAAQVHLETLEQSTAQKAKGDAHLCVGRPFAFSCQLVPPFVQQAPLVVYCDAAECSMPALALNDHIVVSATWPSSSNSLEIGGHEVAVKLDEVSAFFETQR